MTFKEVLMYIYIYLNVHKQLIMRQKVQNGRNQLQYDTERKYSPYEYQY